MGGDHGQDAMFFLQDGCDKLRSALLLQNLLLKPIGSTGPQAGTAIVW